MRHYGDGPRPGIPGLQEELQDLPCGEATFAVVALTLRLPTLVKGIRDSPRSWHFNQFTIKKQNKTRHRSPCGVAEPRLKATPRWGPFDRSLSGKKLEDSLAFIWKTVSEEDVGGRPRRPVTVKASLSIRTCSPMNHCAPSLDYVKPNCVIFRPDIEYWNTIKLKLLYDEWQFSNLQKWASKQTSVRSPLFSF